MATGSRTTDTFNEGLRKLLSTLTDLKTTTDADMPFIINLETIILQRMKQTGSDALHGPGPGGGMGGMPGMPPPGGPMGPGMPSPMGPPGIAGLGPGGPPLGPGPGGPGGPALGPAPVPGLNAGPNMPNPDELRRILSQ